MFLPMWLATPCLDLHSAGHARRALILQIGAWRVRLVLALLVCLVPELESLIEQPDPGVHFWLVTSHPGWS